MCPRQLAGWPSEVASSFHRWTTKESRLDSPFKSFGYFGGLPGNNFAPSLTTSTLHHYAAQAYLACLLQRLFDVSDFNQKKRPPSYSGRLVKLSGRSIGSFFQHMLQGSNFLLYVAIDFLQRP